MERKKRKEGKPFPSDVQRIKFSENLIFTIWFFRPFSPSTVHQLSFAVVSTRTSNEYTLWTIGFYRLACVLISVTPWFMHSSLKFQYSFGDLNLIRSLVSRHEFDGGHVHYSNAFKFRVTHLIDIWTYSKHTLSLGLAQALESWWIRFVRKNYSNFKRNEIILLLEFN